MNPTYTTVYESPQRKSCMEMRLVLEAVGLSTRVSNQAARWYVLVAEQHADLATAELSAYLQEEEQVASSGTTTLTPIGTGIPESVLACSFALIACSMAGWSSTLGTAFTEVGLVDAGLVQGGELWRNFTALSLHMDLTHLLSNLVFGSLFLVLAGKWLGGGVATLLTLAGGATGNLLNALLQDSSHACLGASTAVFAALGISVAMALRPSMQANETTMRRWSPLVAGALLLAMFGTGGERTDVGAHMSGFATGLAIGWVASFIPQRSLKNLRVQSTAALASFFTLVFAWTLAFAMA